MATDVDIDRAWDKVPAALLPSHKLKSFVVGRGAAAADCYITNGGGENRPYVEDHTIWQPDCEAPLQTILLRERSRVIFCR